MRTFSIALLLGLVACGDSAGTTSTTGAGGAGGAGGSGGAGGAGGSVLAPCDDTDLAEEDLGTGADPEAGSFGLDEALDGLPEGTGPLRAIIDTDLGRIVCVLHPEEAPNGVANFVGLARGRRPFKDPGTKHWIKGRRFYDGLLFHRVIDDFVAQGGDPLGTGYGGPGYAFDDEIVDALGPVSDRAAPRSVVESITEVETDADDAPLTPIHMKHVAITRCEW